MPRPDRKLVELVASRSGGICEYCLFPENSSALPFHVDHVIAEKHSGSTEASNLAWACFSCNVHKGPNIAGLDPVTAQLTRLFHPRQDVWIEHFEWQGSWLRGKSAIGRTTIAVLDINHPDSLAVRAALADVDRR